MTRPRRACAHAQLPLTRTPLAPAQVYNGPRAHLNNNDGFGGGQLIENNLIFNSCRESGDHGPFKCVCAVEWTAVCLREAQTDTLRSPPRSPPLLLSRSSWDRDPYAFSDPVSGQRTTVKQYDEIARNFIVANYNSLGAVDNDDGSSYYYVSPRARAREQQGGGAYSLANARRHASPRLATFPPLRPTTTSSAMEGAA
jgi:hypothetical protein